MPGAAQISLCGPPPFHTMEGGIITVNTDTAKAVNVDYSAFSEMAGTVNEVTTE